MTSRDIADQPAASAPSLTGAGLDELLEELLQRVNDIKDHQDRLHLLLEAVVGIASDLSFDSVLLRIVRAASRLVGAKYAALGVLGFGPDRPLREFVHHGLTEQERDVIGELPRGHGLLGLIIDKPEPLRLTEIADHPASYGFPPGHPPMGSFLGVPVRIGDKVFGNLYLTEKREGDFTEQDEAIVVALAAAAGVVIENARLYEEAARRERWLAATAEITAALGGSTDRRTALQLVADRARETAGADLTYILLRTSLLELEVHVVSGVDAPVSVGARVPVTGTLAGLVVSTGETSVVEDASVEERVRAELAPASSSDLGPVMLLPLRTPGGVEGVLVLGWTKANVAAFDEVDVELPQQFAVQAALALQVSQAREGQERLAVFEDRDRIGRDLHDLVIQRLFAIGLSLDNTSRMSQRPEVISRVSTAVDDIDATIKDIRRSIFALNVHADSSDLRSAIRAVVDGATQSLGFTPTLSTEGPLNAAVPPAVVPHLLAVLSEALSNVARHARATSVHISLEVGEEVLLVVADNGQGMQRHTRESGLRHLRERAEMLGGNSIVESSPGNGASVVWRVPARRGSGPPPTPSSHPTSHHPPSPG